MYDCVALSRSVHFLFFIIFFFQAEDGIRDLVRSRGLGDVYKRQVVVRDDGNVDKDLRSRLYHIYMDETVKDDINQKVDESTPVSYTHLTLPTIYSV